MIYGRPCKEQTRSNARSELLFDGLVTQLTVLGSPIFDLYVELLVTGHGLPDADQFTVRSLVADKSFWRTFLRSQSGSLCLRMPSAMVESGMTTCAKILRVLDLQNTFGLPCANR